MTFALLDVFVLSTCDKCHVSEQYRQAVSSVAQDIFDHSKTKSLTEGADVINSVFLNLGHQSSHLGSYQRMWASEVSEKDILYLVQLRTRLKKVGSEFSV